MKNKNKLFVLAGIGAVIGYRAWKGIGAFNRIRFKKQYDTIQSYIDTHYPGAAIGEIMPFKDGWSCSINHNDENIIIYIIPNGDEGFIFSTTKV